MACFAAHGLFSPLKPQNVYNSIGPEPPMTLWHIQKSSIAALLAFMLSAAPACAQSADNVEPPKQIELNADLVKRFVITFSEVRKWEKDNDTTSKTTTDEEEDEEGGEDGSIFAVSADVVKKHPEIQSILKKHNFDSTDKFNEASYSVELAYNYADPEGGLAGQEDSIRKTIEQVKTNKDLSDDEKTEAVKGLESEIVSLQKLRPLSGNVDVVKPYVTEIKKVVESE
jgi:hypothetical protein